MGGNYQLLKGGLSVVRLERTGGRGEAFGEDRFASAPRCSRNPAPGKPRR